MPDELTGLDPDEVRDLATACRSAADEAEAIRTDVTGILAAAVIPDNGFDELCAEIDEELGLLERALDAAASMMETVDAPSAVVAAAALTALWASLMDGTGAGFDTESRDTADEVPMSPVIASLALAEHAEATGSGLGLDELRAIADDEDLPPELRAAALLFVLDPDLWSEVPHQTELAGEGQRPGADAYRHFAEVTLALGVVAAAMDRLTDAAGDEAGGDVADDLSQRDLVEVANDDSGRFSVEEREAAWTLLSDPSLWDDPMNLTLNLVRRRVFGQRPGLGQSYAEWVAQRPTDAVNPLQWDDDERIDDWLDDALLTAETPAEQMAVVAAMARIRVTAPPPEGMERERGVLMAISYLDPTPTTDILVAGTHLVDGNYRSAATSGVNALVPSNPSSGIEGVDRVLRHLRGGDKLIRTQEALLPEEPVTVAETVEIVSAEFGPYAGHVIERYYTDELGLTPEDIAIPAAA